MTKSLRTVELAACLLLLASTVPSGSVLGAPFCVGTAAVQPECIYFDPNSCRARANAMNGFCTVNPQEIVVRPGTGQYCVFTSSMTSNCDYADPISCARDAARQGGACITAPETPGPTAPAPNPDQSLQPPPAG